MNSKIEARTIKEWYEDNKEYVAEQGKKHREKHKEEYKEYDRKYYEDNADEIKQRSKEWRTNNPERKKASTKEQYELKKHERTICEICGHSYPIWSVKSHEKTQKHQQALNNIT